MNRSDLLKNNNATVTEETAGLRNKPNAVDVDDPNIRVKGPKEIIIARNHALLDNLGFEESGHKRFAGIEFGTTAEWDSKVDYRPAKGMIVVYTDHIKKVDPETGLVTYLPGFKIGDGNVYLIDKPFLDDDVREELEHHLEDTGIHVQAGEREFWNNKLNYNEPEGDLLEFTRN